MGVFSEKEAQGFIKGFQEGAKNDLQGATANYLKVVSGTVISVSGDTATVRLAYAPEDGSVDIEAPIITRQTISAGDVVNIAYWCNLSTAIVLSK